MDYWGTVIEESLSDRSALNSMQIVSTRVVVATPRHKTPWVKQWTLHSVSISESHAEDVAKQLSESLDKEHAWYADFKNEATHYVIFCGRIFKVDRAHPEQYKEATDYGLSLGIPNYQLDFSPHMKEWEANK